MWRSEAPSTGFLRTKRAKLGDFSHFGQSIIPPITGLHENLGLQGIRIRYCIGRKVCNANAAECET